MKKRLYTVLALLIYSALAFAEDSDVVLSIEGDWCYQFEQVQVNLDLPAVWRNSLAAVELHSVAGDILIDDVREKFGSRINDETGERESFYNKIFRIFPRDGVPLKLRAKVTLNDGRSFFSNTVDHEVLSLPDGETFPYIKIHSLTESWIAGQPVHVLVEVFSKDRVSEVALPFPERENVSFTPVKPLEEKLLLLSPGNEIYIKSYPLRILFEEPGEYGALFKDMELLYSNRDEPVRYNEVTPVIQEPVRVYSSDSVEGEAFWLDISSRVEPEIWEQGKEVRLFVSLSTNGAITDLDSLLPYADLPSFLEEESHPSWYKWEGDGIRENRVYHYSGVVPRKTGVNLRSLELPGEIYGGKESVNFDFGYQKGNKNPLVFAAIHILVLVGGVLLLVFFSFFVKGKKKRRDYGDAPPEQEIHHFSDEFGLTNRERDVLKVLVEGKSTKEIADELFISPETAKKHIKNIMSKTETHSRLEIFVLLDGFIKKISLKTKQ
ncbi:MAG: helix-turn-helix transcriptional regulator [Spirochaetales bacterium]|nr:helix-turn-helix transcriptional regulator [Spirochaetales bacterium]